MSRLSPEEVRRELEAQRQYDYRCLIDLATRQQLAQMNGCELAAVEREIARLRENRQARVES